MASESDPTRTNPQGADAPQSEFAAFPSRESGAPGRFLSGSIFAGRYRIIALLGRGAMGEVYRADDLKLNQPVALKFLPNTLARDMLRLARFHNEVRLARQISHPNVCRVHDIGEVSGEHFLSMEYVNGEDLAFLLRQIGRMPREKGIEIAWQLCVGLAAAHNAGVVHGDLKPANVMIDEWGRVKITDFGLAAIADHPDGQESAGTPTFMAPEQLRGSPASVRSDIYALGLVLYELFTGQPAFTKGSFTSAALSSRAPAPAPPAAAFPQIDPDVERVLVWCLAEEPERRPASALAVAATLPGGDHLAAVLAAGETPSPEIVSAAGGVGSLDSTIAWGCFAFIVVGLVLVALSGQRVTVYRFLAGSKSPPLLKERAESIVASFGYGSEGLDSAVGFTLRDEFLEDVEPRRHDEKDTGMRDRHMPIAFWYRQSPQYLIPSGLSWRPSLSDPPTHTGGMKSALLDLQGRLIEFRAVPSDADTSKGDVREPDWSTVFLAAGLRPENYMRVASSSNPPVYADTSAAWERRLAGQPDTPIRLESAAYRGRIVYFRVVPSRRAAQSVRTGELNGSRSLYVVLVALMAVSFAGAVVIARRNVRLGRGDSKRASRLAMYVLFLGALSFVMGADHVSGVVEEFSLFVRAASIYLIYAATFWLFYLAVEPHFRRWWPERIISWTRLLSGRFRDPLVGRDILLGAAFAAGSHGLFSVCVVALQLFRNGRAAVPYGGLPASAAAATFDERSLLGLRSCIGLLPRVQIDAMGRSLGLMLLLVLLTFVLRKRTRAMVALWLVLLLLTGLAVSTWSDRVLFSLTASTMVTVVLLRFGVLALMSTLTFFSLMQFYPVTANLSAWYSSATIFAIAACLALAGYGLYTTLGGKPFAGWKVIEQL